MKKLSLLLLVTLLCATPAMATVRIIADSNEAQVVAIRYETDGEMVRAFALDVTVDMGAFIGISDFIRGESTAEIPGYGIFPANFGRYITVDSETGEVAAWDPNEYTPIADPCDPGALGGLGTAGVTLEMGALYYPPEDDSPNAPGNTGLLCKLILSTAANVSVTLNEIRSGIVLTDPTVPPVVDLSAATNVPVEAISLDGVDYDEWVAVGMPACWTYPHQCYGDADGLAESDGTSGVSYVGQEDLDLLTLAFQVKEPPFGPGIASVANGICADFSHDQEGDAVDGFHRVGNTDLNILSTYWMIKEAPDGPGIPDNCAARVQP
jgi:hypothetical protein